MSLHVSKLNLKISPIVAQRHLKNGYFFFTSSIGCERYNVTDYEFVTPKTTGFVRIIDIDENVMKLLKDHQEPLCSEECLKPNGTTAQENINKKAAIPHIFRLRHTHISMLAEAGVDLKTIMQRVGHNDPDTTLRIYTQ